MSDRRFGVEIECGIENDPDHNHIYSTLTRNGLHDWTVGEDGTYAEIRTGILQGVSGFDELRLGLKVIREMGGYVTHSDGLHVHHDAPEFRTDITAIIRLVRAWRANQAAIYKMVSPARHDSEPCPSWPLQSIQHLEQRRELAGYGRHDLNITPLASRGSIEIRLHEGTLDYDEAEAWILFGQKFLDDTLADHAPNVDTGSTSALLQQLALGDKTGAFLLAKAERYGHTF